MTRITLAHLTLAVLSLTGAALIISAGPLDPPAGAVGSNYKTLTEVEPRIAINAANTPGDADSLFKISQPGAYYLTGNVSGTAGKHGIEIVANGVTLDLKGFDLVGVAGSLDGVSATAGGLANIAVLNGSVRNWANTGVDLGTTGARRCRVVEVILSDNGAHGVTSGQGGQITHCSAHDNGGDGIQGTTVSSCSAYANAGSGIIVNGSATDCWASNNGAATGDGIVGVADCVINNCNASANLGGAGIRVGDGATVSNCTASGNGLAGIIARTGCTVSNCSALNNSGNFPSIFGISVGNGSTVSSCSAVGNAGSGIGAGVGCTVVDCTLRQNTVDGIVCSSACTISANSCSNNGFNGNGSGVHATAQDNRIEGNNCTGGNRGLDIDAAGNIISRNVCSGNITNWDIVAGNVCLVVQGTTGGAILGNTGGAAPGSTDPNANFTY
ncbi:MAG: right-handed parallel beta-helix repeat-containing protein [Planctomycetota bacterium]